AAQFTIGTWLHVPLQETMVWVNVVCGAMAMGVSYLLALELFGSRRLALITTAILALSGRVMNNATSSEIYMSQTLFVLLAFYLFVRARTIGAGVAAGCALLISPLSAFAYLFFPVYDFQRAGRIRWATLAMLTAAAAVVYVPYLVVYGHELFYGIRGLLVINDVVKPDPMTALANIPKYQFKQYTFLLLLLPATLIAAPKHARFLVLAAAVAIPHLYIIFKLTGEDNVFILNTDFFFAATLALGWIELANGTITRWVGPALLAMHVAVLLVSGYLFSFQAHRQYDHELRDVATAYLVNHNAIMITDWGTAVALVYFGRPKANSTILTEPLFQQIYDVEAPPDRNPDLGTARDLYLLDRWKPSPLSQFFRTKQSIREQYQLHSVKLIAERTLHVSCTLMVEATNKLYRCTLNPSLARP
ncbi:MAG: glycosyltransferase family 39 protein, partial [Gemmatimonadota bacterium]|nr:glycosyltransferase family 39 protein [Gemmatimonadota bacterium]